MLNQRGVWRYSLAQNHNIPSHRPSSAQCRDLPLSATTQLPSFRFKMRLAPEDKEYLAARPPPVDLERMLRLALPGQQ